MTKISIMFFASCTKDINFNRLQYSSIDIHILPVGVKHCGRERLHSHQVGKNDINEVFVITSG